MPGKIIPAERSIIVGADVPPEKFSELVRPMEDVEAVSAIKIGFEVAWGGLQEAVYEIKSTRESLIALYDHQKGGTDIDKTGINFARGLDRAGIDAAILFPFTGSKVQTDWTKALRDKGIGVVIGSEMTHEGFLRSEGGRIDDDSLIEIFEQAIEEGVTSFVVPGNKPAKVREYRKFIEGQLGEGNFELMAPGLIAQGGTISEAGEAAGQRWHAIIASAIVEALDKRTAAMEHGREILERKDS